MIVGDYFADYCDSHEIEINTNDIEKFVKKEEDYLKSLVEKESKFNVFEIKNKMKDIMWEHVAIFRTGEGLAVAVKELEELYKQSLNVIWPAQYDPPWRKARISAVSLCPDRA